ncbi:TPA: hypothetical protein ACNV4G_003323 [Serratia marcescens]|uniref:hypothetical protein n=1 Tax=Serratia TaxID=613 RepID=UPI001021E4D2|nr:MULTISPECIES: hypothetical protein [Serratia]RYM48286.1 hypothetical protein BSQ96_21925 [Serratia proteamaculans]
MNNSNKTGMGHNDNSPFMDVIFGETGNMIVCGKTASGKTTMLPALRLHLEQIRRRMRDNLQRAAQDSTEE